MWQRIFPFKALIAIFWELQPLWPSSPTKRNLLRFRCSSGHALSKTKSVTPHFFYISDITKSSSFNGKIFRKKSVLENFRANVLNRPFKLFFIENTEFSRSFWDGGNSEFRRLNKQSEFRFRSRATKRNRLSKRLKQKVQRKRQNGGWKILINGARREQSR